MKKFLILILAFFVFLGNGHSNDNNGLRAPFTVSATTGSVPGKDTYVTEIRSCQKYVLFNNEQ